MTRLILSQVFIVIAIGIVAWFFVGTRGGLSALLGGIAWMLPNTYFMHKLFVSRKARTGTQIVKDFYVGELIKLLLSGFLIALAVKFLPIEVLPFFVGFIITLLISWFGSVLILIKVK